jgi:hypothetical protein
MLTCKIKLIISNKFDLFWTTTISLLIFKVFEKKIPCKYSKNFLQTSYNRALSPARWRYQSEVKVAAFLNN